MKQQEFESYLKAGEITKQVKIYLKEFIKKDILLLEIAEKVEEKIEQLGGKPAFPVNTSIDEIAAHYTPSKDDTTKAEGLLTIDFGVEIDGFIADNAITFDFTQDKKHKNLIEKNQDVLKKVLDSLTYESEVQEIGNKVDSELQGSNFQIVRNLTGHSLDEYDIHSDLSIPNIKNQDSSKLKEQAIAIEPFLTTGTGEVNEGKPSEIFMLVQDKKVRDPQTRKVLEFIKEEYKTKPFCKRWLEKQGFRTIFSLNNLVKEEILYNFPVLIETSKAPVSQFEETAVFHDGKKHIITEI